MYKNVRCAEVAVLVTLAATTVAAVAVVLMPVSQDCYLLLLPQVLL